MPEPPTLVRRGRLLRIGAAVAVLLALVGYVVMQYVFGGKAEPRCEVVSGDGDGASYEFSAEQAENAATVAAVGTSRGMPERAVTIALATALQESGLRNIGHGDRDSLGLFQQRPSQGWGDEKQIMDPAYSAARFYAHLDKVPGYSRLPLTVAAQRVQRSGYPQAYAKHEPDAALLAAALTGRAPATLSCEGREPVEPGDPAEVRAALVRDFGRDVAPKGDGRTVTVPVTATTGTAGGGAGRHGWELAHWAVAQASALGIERVSYAGREWRVGDSGKEWHKPGKAGEKGTDETGAGAGDGAGEVRIVTGQ
ncbi:heavy metal transporter [Streptomyces sp. MZ04]|uniref:heavy metal transporter n=1 Tax=Streptomyces sp. MZ04 TaxID=2559236 RepID=UPI00107ECAA6|nr:heavy metal transporter [Streptomyces sp. MZ04]TGB05871.1 heavy metal transporter [Streptomyces sp. MZ04]